LSGEIILYKKRQLKGHQGNYTNTEKGVNTMAETTYENLTRRIDRINAEMREIGEKMGLIAFRYWQVR
jgi:hypothetical protein